MNQRTAVIVLVLVCLMTVIGLVEVRGWEDSESETELMPERESERPGCYDIIMHPKFSPGGASGRVFLLDGCTGNTWSWILDNEQISGGVWFPVRKY